MTPRYHWRHTRFQDMKNLCIDTKFLLDVTGIKSLATADPGKFSVCQNVISIDHIWPDESSILVEQTVL